MPSPEAKTKLRRWGALPTPMTRVCFRGQRVLVKRDDMLFLAGNKMRKLYWFVQQDKAFYKDAHLFSYGGTQSNAMLAIAQLAHIKRVPFTYFSRALDIPTAGRAPEASLSGGARHEGLAAAGNLREAKALGMRHETLPPDAYHALVRTRDFASALEFSNAKTYDTSRTPLLIPQGGAFPKARVGVAMLADEINNYARSELPDAELAVVVPCGTGTTAFYLAQHVLPAVEVFAVPCVGDGAYLSEQFGQLAREDDASLGQSDGSRRLPTVLEPARKSRFGRLWWPLLEMHHEVLAETGIEFDLVYAAFAWHTLFNDGAIGRVTKPGQSGKTSRELMYVHTGGVSGNETMIERYERKKRRQRSILETCKTATTS